MSILETKLPIEKIIYIGKQLPKYTAREQLQSAVGLYEKGTVEELELIKQSSIDAEVTRHKVRVNPGLFVIQLVYMRI